MSLTSQIIGDIQVITAQCVKLDIATHRDLTDMFNTFADGARDVILDMKAIRSMDSAGFGSLMTWRRRLKSRGRDLLLCGLAPSIDRALRSMKLDLIFHISPDCPAAIEHARAQRAREGQARMEEAVTHAHDQARERTQP